MHGCVGVLGFGGIFLVMVLGVRWMVFLIRLVVVLILFCRAKDFTFLSLFLHFNFALTSLFLRNEFDVNSI